MKLMALVFSVMALLLVMSSSLFAEEYTNSLGMEFVRIPAGSFEMGDDQSMDPNAFGQSQDELPLHTVVISQDFFIGKHEVTQAQWEAAMGSNPSYFEGKNKPVDSISWDQAQEFILKLNQKEETDRYRLPTEAEWEYAVRAGTKGAYFFADQSADPENLKDYAWLVDNSDDKTRDVGEKSPNPWGLYDVYGNVSEWVADWYDETYYASSPETDPKGPDKGWMRVARGGSWNSYAAFCRSQRRSFLQPDSQSKTLGMRLVSDVR
ncbi:MAG: formylglycine-generating enzyme family protein [Deltaproteobacteria bacterium]|nr:formylglycine-generating enzyme family protein [Deltaproteobacteria bacterium]